MSKKKLIIIACIILAIIALFIFRTGGNKNPSTDGIAGEATNQLGNEFVLALLGVEKVTLDTSLLKSPVFQSLLPSGAVINTDPQRGRIDPFAKQSTVEKIETQPSQSSREITLGNFDDVSLLPSGAAINVSKITSTTATISISGLPAGLGISIRLSSPQGNTISLSDFSYKSSSSEYSTVATGLSSKSHYTVSIINPTIYSALQAEFDTK